MKYLLPLLATLPLALSAPQSLSQLMPGFGSFIIPPGPAPTGCNDYELIVGRGTSEPGPYGVIVGDPLVAAVQKLLPGARGYSVQVRKNLPIPAKRQGR
jgi:hypothetical protein